MESTKKIPAHPPKYWWLKWHLVQEHFSAKLNFNCNEKFIKEQFVHWTVFHRTDSKSEPSWRGHVAFAYSGFCFIKKKAVKYCTKYAKEKPYFAILVNMNIFTMAQFLNKLLLKQWESIGKNSPPPLKYLAFH